VYFQLDELKKFELQAALRYNIGQVHIEIQVCLLMKRQVAHQELEIPEVNAPSHVLDGCVYVDGLVPSVKDIADSWSKSLRRGSAPNRQ
jgi:hypothetical protein